MLSFAQPFIKNTVRKFRFFKKNVLNNVCYGHSYSYGCKYLKNTHAIGMEQAIKLSSDYQEQLKHGNINIGLTIISLYVRAENFSLLRYMVYGQKYRTKVLTKDKNRQVYL